MEKASICPKDLEYIISRQRSDLDVFQKSVAWSLVSQLDVFLHSLSQTEIGKYLSPRTLSAISEQAESIAGWCRAKIEEKGNCSE